MSLVCKNVGLYLRRVDLPEDHIGFAWYKRGFGSDVVSVAWKAWQGTIRLPEDGESHS